MNVRLIGALLVLGLISPCATLAAGNAPGGPDIPDSATLANRVTQAVGVLPESYVETITWHASSDIDGTVTEYRRGNDARIVSRDGPFETERGSYKGDRWHQDANGLTVIDQPTPAGDVPESTVTTVTRVTQPFDAYVISVLNHNGYGDRRYVDTRTSQMLRTVRHTPNGDITTDYDSFQNFGKATLPTHWVTKDTVSLVTTEYRRTGINAKAPADADIVISPIRRELIAFPSSTSSVTLPARIMTNGHVVVRVEIGGRGYDFLLDTGASGIFIDPSVASANGLTLYNAHSRVVAGRFQTAETIIPELHVGPLVMKNIAASIGPQRFADGPGVATVGLLGFDFLATLGVTIDYEHERVTVVPAQYYVPPVGTTRYTLDVRVGNQTPETTAYLNGARADRITIDTGGVGDFLIFDYFARRHPDALKDHNGLGARMPRRQMAGIGGTFDTQALAIDDFHLGNLAFRDFIARLVKSNYSYDYPGDGVIGADLLRLFTVGIDLANSRIDLVPTASTRKRITAGK